MICCQNDFRISDTTFQEFESFSRVFEKINKRDLVKLNKLKSWKIKRLLSLK